jgi:macrolide-specific efflux system membrane fusion protein
MKTVIVLLAGVALAACSGHEGEQGYESAQVRAIAPGRAAVSTSAAALGRAAVVTSAAASNGDAPTYSDTPARAGAATRPAASAAFSAPDVIAVGIVKSQVGAEVKVGSQLSGIVAKLHVNVGDVVTRGEALAELDDAQWRARVASLEAELVAAEAELAYARSDVSRMERVASYSPAQVENGRRNAQVREAMVGQARAKLDEARVELGYTRIRAPISGTVASVSTYEGETVAAAFSAPTFVTIVDLARLEVQAYVDEHDIGAVRAGERVRFRVDAFRDRELAGTVRAIYPKPQLINNVVNYIVIVDFENPPDLVVRPEMTTHVTFTPGNTREAKR